MRSSFVLSALFLGALASAGTAAAQKAVVVVRHAENEKDALTEAGRARAERLSTILVSAGIGAVYSTDTVRTTETAKPLAAARKITVKTYDTADGKDGVDARPFVSQLRKDHPGDVVLVVGHSTTVPDILKALGCGDEVTVAPKEYDNLFVVVPDGKGGASLVRLKY
jgi:broad specificity phosphatase PhoE